ncbi:hypothetical protein PR202_gn00760 [Eleusine coracana subsp. coracana]|uniref:Myb-like domain-containing protein n=1 Tax=Eleusine coracana subsp. coracana TaxID=191504 RepID=A0AAV5G3V9_ELECO|nr:hypothetical protein QOZ80_3BG0276440 [Eleusine coracana subsp. coracana]GJN41389.1 hypothetical protein PR202_gn00760 [Eleusine coracana subsp. coracana]
MACVATSSPPAAASVRSVLVINKKQSPPSARRVLRFRPSAAWTPEEDATRHWRASPTSTALLMPGRSSRQCRGRWRHHLARDDYLRPFTARDDEELARLFMRHDGRWKDVSRAAHRRTSRVMRRRWKEIRDTDAFLSKLWNKPDAESDSSTTSSLSSQLQFLGSGLPCFFSLASDAATMSLPACVTVA